MKSVFITGISSGIGKDAAVALAKKGYRVFGTVRKDEDRELLKKEGHSNLEVVIMDVTEDESIANAKKSILEKAPEIKLNGLINNAGIAIPGPLKYISDHDFEKQMQVNLFAVRKVTNAFLPLLGYPDKNHINPGKIINISSVSGLFNTPFNGTYCISKHALESMTDIYRRELLPFGIDVIAIEPGPIKTNIWNKAKGAAEKYRNTPYQEILKKADKMIEAADKNALETKYVSDLIHEVLESDRPKTRYIVHRKKWLFKVLAKYVPDRMLDKMIWKNLRNTDTYRPV